MYTCIIRITTTVLYNASQPRRTRDAYAGVRRDERKGIEIIIKLLLYFTSFTWERKTKRKLLEGDSFK